jgi:hypothetical protein
MNAQVAVAPVLPPTTPVAAVIDPVPYFHRAWPPTVLTVALIINLAWIGLLAYGAFQLRWYLEGRPRHDWLLLRRKNRKAQCNLASA